MGIYGNDLLFYILWEYQMEYHGNISTTGIWSFSLENNLQLQGFPSIFDHRIRGYQESQVDDATRYPLAMSND